MYNSQPLHHNGYIKSIEVDAYVFEDWWNRRPNGDLQEEGLLRH